MYKLMTLAAVLVALALAPVLGGVSDDRALRDPVDASRARVHPIEAEPAPSGEAPTCDWSCETCEPDQGCQQICSEIGDCGSTCGVIAHCDAQHVWSDEACSCVGR
jgi:hypothetical protein